MVFPELSEPEDPDPPREERLGEASKDSEIGDGL
jgi:hypothetical protein